MTEPTISVHDAYVRVLLEQDAPDGWVCMIPGDESSKCWFASARNAAAWMLSQDPQRIGTAYEYVISASIDDTEPPSWHVEDNITGQKVSRDYATEEQANGACRALNMVASGGKYGVYDQNGERA